MTWQQERPLLLYPFEGHSHHIVFRLHDRDIDITVPFALRRELLSRLDGTETVDSIVSALENRWSRQSLLRFIRRLFSVGVLADSGTLAPFIWQFIRNPSPWYRGLSGGEIDRLMRDTSLQNRKLRRSHHFQIRKKSIALTERRSVRLFGKRKVSAASVARVLWFTYGVTSEGGTIPRRTVPSAGALYPLVIHLVMLRSANGLEPGIYRVQMVIPGEVNLVEERNSPNGVEDCFVERVALHQATGFIAISGSFNRSGRKYGNRGILYTVLEAGHAAQNAILGAQEESLAACEVGGFMEAKDPRMRKSIDLAAGQVDLGSTGSS